MHLEVVLVVVVGREVCCRPRHLRESRVTQGGRVAYRRSASTGPKNVKFMLNIVLTDASNTFTELDGNHEECSNLTNILNWYPSCDIPVISCSFPNHRKLQETIKVKPVGRP